MKFRNRALTLLLSLAMLLTFMPAMAFADGEGDGQDQWREFVFIGGEGIPDHRLYSDGEARFGLPEGVGVGADQELIVDAGIWSEEAEGYIPEYKFTEGKEFSFDKNAGVLTFYGDKIYQKLGDQFHDFSFFAGVSGGENQWLWHGGGWCEFRVAGEPEYDFEENRDMLPGWGNGIDGSRAVWVDNADHPEEEAWYSVTDVEVVSGAELLGYFEKSKGDDGDYWWEYGFKDAHDLNGNRGTVTFKVTYKDIDGKTKSYTFNRTVVDDVYELDVWPERGRASWQALPGSTVGLIAKGEHFYIDENGNEQYELVTDTNAYEWTFRDADGFAKSLKARTDTHEADLTFKTLAELGRNKDELFEGEVEVTVSLKNSKASRDCRVIVAALYDEMYPLDLDLKPGQTITQKFEVKRFSVSEGPKTIAAKITVKSNDPDMFRITGGSNNTFTIKRLTGDGGSFFVDANWQEDGSETNNLGRDYDFEWQEYRPNPMTVKAKTATVNLAKLKKKNQTIPVTKYLTIKKAQGKLSYKLAATDKKAGKKIIVDKKTGKITIKKGLKRGKYIIKVKVTAAGNLNYMSGSKTVKVTITVK